ncbi:alternative oxidase, mitochondrial-like [Pomacea canaliculata]|uniref:alternative oxidase, mitochondrial-like n=1 Tax=Pomacea canaliculata TaxID=400727 RepID=UPI000D7291B8|nr:alternative oxidase, mitochondrial-like [Pomacea canaliculata]
MSSSTIFLRSSARTLCASRIVISAAELNLSSAPAVGRLVCAVAPQVRHLTTQREIRENIKDYREGKFDKIPDPGHLEHFRNKSERKVKVAEEGERSQQGAQQVQGVQNVPGVDGEQSVQGAQGHINEEPPMGVYAMPHPIWTEDQLHDVKVTHKPPEGIVDRLALITVKTLRGCFDVFSGFKTGQRTDAKWLNRIIFLETVAAVPGMVAAMVRHMKSLRWMQRDHGWIHTLLEEAENERMHLMTALQLKQPSTLFRMSVIGVQGVFVTMFFVWYAVSPRFCHRFVGYLEEEAVKTYSKCLEDMEHGSIIHWKTLPAPPVAINYWRLPENAKLRDVILAIRADEAHHRVVNHTLASLKKDEFNPYKPGH